MKLNKKYLTISVIVVALVWTIGTVNGQTSTDVISEEDVDMILDDDTAVEIEWEEAPIAVAAGFKDASSLGKKGSKQTTKISRSDRKRVAKLFGFKDASGLDKVKGGTSPATRSGKKKVAKAFGYKDAASIEKVKREVITISKSDHKQLAKMFGFKVNNLKVGVGNVELKLDEKQKKLVAKAFGYRSYHKSKDGQSINDAKKHVRFTKSEKKELKKALKLK